MITPAPTTKLDPGLARGVLARSIEQTATRPAMVHIQFPNTSYELHLVPTTPITADPGRRIVGVIAAEARRIDTVGSGGRYVEPVFGRPRRVQGRVIGSVADAVVIDAGVPIHCHPTDARQKAADFKPGDFVSFDVLAGATFAQRD